MSDSLLLPGLKHIGMALEQAAKPVHSRYGGMRTRLLMDWDKIVGKTLARSSRPARLVFKAGERTEGLLYIDIYHSSLATQMLFMQPVILERIATYFGYKAVANIKIQQKPAALDRQVPVPMVRTPTLERSVYQDLSYHLEDIEDGQMKMALQRLLDSL